MIKRVLRDANQELFEDASELLEVVEKTLAVPELRAYRDFVADRLSELQAKAQDHLELLALDFIELLPELLSRTQQLTRELSLFSHVLIGPLRRRDDRDQFSLRLLSWLHRMHKATAEIPVATAEGAFASWPWPPYPTIYFVPGASLTGLRYLPLLFHEFGHLLYATHARQLDQVVARFQRKIEHLLMPRFARDDSRADVEARTRAQIVQTWFEWVQEFFCDAVGLSIGGPSFLFSFSNHLRLRGPGDFGFKLATSTTSHPPTWLRIELLCDRCKTLGFPEIAHEIQGEWKATADVAGVSRDYYGYYNDEFLPILLDTLQEMLGIARPYNFSSDGLDAKNLKQATGVQIFNTAWNQYKTDKAGYRQWERLAIKEFLENGQALHSAI